MLKANQNFAIKKILEQEVHVAHSHVLTLKRGPYVYSI